MKPLPSPLTVLALPLLLSAVTAVSADLEEVIVVGVQDRHVLYTDDSLVASADTGELLRRLPGANVNRNGELTGIAQYRGMAGERVAVTVDGAAISPGGPNAMDAPLHYAPTALLESLTVYRGITPVSVGPETMGGKVEARTWRGEFTKDSHFSAQGRAYLGAQSANTGTVGSGLVALANRSHVLRASLMQEAGSDREAADARVIPSEYRRQRADVGYRHRRGASEIDLHYARNETGDTGTPALPMDIRSVDSDLASLRYAWENEGLRVSTQIAVNAVEHWMTNFHLRRPPQGPLGDDRMRFRQAFTTADSLDFRLQIEQGLERLTLRYGIDAHRAQHDATVSNPNSGAFRIDNFNGVRRDIGGSYVEVDMQALPRLGISGGLRVNRVDMRAGEVAANLNPMGLGEGMPVRMNALAAGLAERFNASDRRQRDTHLDGFLRITLDGGPAVTGYVGAARKTRSPSYQERYLWLPMESTGGLADGKTYIGDTTLRPEVAHEVELGVDVLTARWTVRPRLFYRRVDDFIQGTPATDPDATRFAAMMAGMSMGDPEPLQFSNVSALFRGADLEAALRLDARWSLRAVASAVRAERRDIDDDLYRIAPDNIRLAVDYATGRWQTTLEGVHYRGQSRVAATQREQSTGDWSVLNLSARWQPQPGLELAAGVDNLLDRDYRDHLAGYNRAFNPEIALGERLPGIGRNVYARVVYRLR